MGWDELRAAFWSLAKEHLKNDKRDVPKTITLNHEELRTILLMAWANAVETTCLMHELSLDEEIRDARNGANGGPDVLSRHHRALLELSTKTWLEWFDKE